MDLSKTGKTIAKLRRSAGFTQASLAEKLGISDKAVSKWERGIACPDVSLWNKLSILLDTDIESLIYGHEIGNKWHGALILDDNMSVSTVVYNKPLIHYLISQFLLVGITKIAIVGRCEKIELPGVQIYLCDNLNEVNQRFRTNLFIIWGNSYIYGPNITKHFKRAMSRENGVTVLASMRRRGLCPITLDAERKVESCKKLQPNQYFAESYVFVSGPIDELSSYAYPKVLNNADLYAETMVRGMIIFDLNNYESVLEMAEYVKMMEKTTGERISCLEEILVRRGICDLKTAKKTSTSDTRKYLGTIFNN